MHLWSAQLELSSAEHAEAARVLSPDELARAQRMRSDPLRTAALASALALRRVLAPYVGAQPAELVFERAGRGKPTLRPSPGCANPHFNLSHSGPHLLVAVCAERAVGVDVEEVRPGPVEEEGLLERVLGEGERALLASVPAARRARLFFEVWTCKEALMKATGLGLGLDPLELEVLLPGAGGPRLATRAATPAGPHALHALELFASAPAALAVPGPPAILRRF